MFSHLLPRDVSQNLLEELLPNSFEDLESLVKVSKLLIVTFDTRVTMGASSRLDEYC